MNIAGIKNFDVENGAEVGVSVFVSGCTHNCYGCFNKEAQNFNYGRPFNREEDIKKIRHMLDSKYISRLTILGGEPMEYQNVEGVLEIIKSVKDLDKKIWLYSGYTLEELLERSDNTTNEIIDNLDYLVDGEFVLEKKNLMLRFKGSSNQRVIDVPKSLESGKIVLSKYND